MENSKKMESNQQNFDVDKDDDDVSVIAVIGKENNRSSRQQQDEKPSKKQEDRRVFELSNERCKMALRKQLDLKLLSTEQDNVVDDYEDVEILQKLPPETIVIKQEKKYKDDSDYVRDSTETSSGGSSSSSGVTKVKRIHRATKKSRGPAEVRRNPIRVTKKDPDKDFSRPRQRLLSVKRKEMLLNLEPTKRGKSTMPYMNTRSVTRKMYNVGATYQAPTIKDETEWKEWPVHGMHERPVFHPQVGLAAEYLGRYFTSLDGFSYREIIDRPEIEVVSVDPHCDYLPSSTEKKQNKKTKPNKDFFNTTKGKTDSLDTSEKCKSFETCMHESFHSVLGYCSQVMTPAYKASVEGKINMLNDSKNSSKTSKEMEKQSLMNTSMTSIGEQSSKSESSVSFDNLQKSAPESKFFNSYGVTMFPQNVKSFTQVPKSRLFPAQKVYIANSQKSIAFTNLKTLQGGQMKIHDVVRSSKSPFILLNSSDTKEKQLSKSVSRTVNTNKIDESFANEETLGELTSIYKNVSNEEPTGKKRGNKVEFTVTKYLFDNMQQNKFQMGKECNTNEKKLCYETSGKDLHVKAVSTDQNKTWCNGETSEIAKILSEYNKSNLKKSAIENQTFYPSMKNIKLKELCIKGENAKQSIQETSTNKNMNISFPQGKWRRFHLTVEKLKDLKGNSNEKRQSVGLLNRQSLFKIDQTTGEIFSDRKVENSKQLETFQRRQSNVINLEKKENTSTVTRNVDATITKTQSLQELLENTAMLYCAATGTHQDDLANYIDNLDAAQSIQWLETCNNLIA